MKPSDIIFKIFMRSRTLSEDNILSPVYNPSAWDIAIMQYLDEQHKQPAKKKSNA